MIRLRSVFAGFFFFIAASTLIQAGQLTIAVIQYMDARNADSLAAGFAATTLSEVTDSNKVEARDSAIRGGRVLFSQTIPVGKNTSFASSTRLGVMRADVSGKFNQPNLKVEVVVQEGVDVGIRKFSQSVFAGSGALANSNPTIISIRESTGKTQTAVKGNATLKTYNFTTLVLAQWKN